MIVVARGNEKAAAKYVTINVTSYVVINGIKISPHKYLSDSNGKLESRQTDGDNQL